MYYYYKILCLFMLAPLFILNCSEHSEQYTCQHNGALSTIRGACNVRALADIGSMQVSESQFLTCITYMLMEQDCTTKPNGSRNYPGGYID